MKKKKILALAAVLAIALIAWIAWGNAAIEVSEIIIADAAIPESFSGFRIAQVSDLHNAEFGEGNARLLEKLAAAEPDIIVITGDVVDSRRTNLDIALDFAQKAVEIAPAYYVTGNHEARISEYAELKVGLEAAGVTALENERALLERNGASIALLGVDDPSFSTGYLIGYEAAVAEKAIAGLRAEEDGYTILLAHRPELFETYVDAGANLVFSGHAHGGQFRLPFVGGLFAPGQGFFPEYDAGVFAENATTMIVSRGLGNSLFPFRIGNRPEIVIAELRHE